VTPVSSDASHLHFFGRKFCNFLLSVPQLTEKKSAACANQPSDEQGDQNALEKKIAQNVAQPIFKSKLFLTYNVEKEAEGLALLLYFKKLPKFYNPPIGEISPNPVTMPRGQVKKLGSGCHKQLMHARTCRRARCMGACMVSALLAKKPSKFPT
jgi:hypothetical protein